MLDFVRAYLDELLTSLFLLLVAVLTVARPPHFATPGGLLLARIVLWSATILVCVLLAAARCSSRARFALHFVFEFGPIVVAVVGYSGLQLLGASAITARLAIPSFAREMMAADTDRETAVPGEVAQEGWSSARRRRMRCCTSSLAALCIAPKVSQVTGENVHPAVEQGREYFNVFAFAAASI